MADFVRVPEADWKNILDATREKAGSTGKMVSGEVAAAIAGIQAGGGSGGGFPAVKFMDVNITVDESTTTAKTYTVDGVETPTNKEDATQWASFNRSELFIFVINPVEITGTASAEYTSISEGAFCAAEAHSTNYTMEMGMRQKLTNGKYSDSGTYGFYNPVIVISKKTDGKLIGKFTVSVRHNSSLAYGVLAGTYNIKGYFIADIAEVQ